MSHQIGVNWIAILLCGSLIVASHDCHAGELIVHAHGFKNNKGKAIASVYRSQSEMFLNPYYKLIAPVENGEATFDFSEIPPGQYAVTVFQDKNNNQTLDHNWLHFPAEPLGFSNHFKLGLTSGFPNFKKLQFPHQSNSQSIDIEVK